MSGALARRLRAHIETAYVPARVRATMAAAAIELDRLEGENRALTTVLQHTLEAVNIVLTDEEPRT